MTNSITIAPPYSMIYISDSDLGDDLIPNRNHINWTDKVISISCLNYQDGDTTVTLGSISDVALFSNPIVDREIETPSRKVVVTTAELKVVLSAKSELSRTRVRIWENHPTEPDDIVIGLG